VTTYARDPKLSSNDLEPARLRFDGVDKHYRGVDQTQRAGRRRSGRRGREEHWAVRDLSFEVGPNETLGLIGANGAGKSTLLRLAAGVSHPSAGAVTTAGRVAGILDLGGGFHPLLTGRENAVTGGILAGLSSQEAAERIEAILEFSELGSSIDDPLRTYSSGMFVRLAFAVAVHVDADLLLIDEALAVGDIAFRAKCLDHLAAVQARGTSIVFASHDSSQIRALSNRVMWLDGGRLRMLGAPEEVIGSFEMSMYDQTLAATPPGEERSGRLGSGEYEITSVDLTTREDRPANSIPSGWPLNIDITYRAHADVRHVIFGVSVHTERGERCFDVSTDGAGVAAPHGLRTGTARLSIERLDLVGGRYHVDAGIYTGDWSHALDYQWQARWMTVLGPRSRGPMAPPHSWGLS